MRLPAPTEGREGPSITELAGGGHLSQAGMPRWEEAQGGPAQVAGQMPQMPIIPSWRIWLQPTTPKGAPHSGAEPTRPACPPTPTEGWDIN